MSSEETVWRTNATPEDLAIGDKVTVAGNPSKFAAHRLWGTNILTSRHREIVLELNQKPRWAVDAVGTRSTWFDRGSASAAKLGLFRVWSSKLDDPGFNLWRPKYPLTAAARKKVAAWNPDRDTVTPGCQPKGMPTIMEAPYPMEFVDHGSTILLRMEEYDTVRTIDMKGSPPATTLPESRLGVSAGHWEGKTLVVETSRISWRYLDPSGVPLGPNARLLERFTPNEGGSRLSYELQVIDPETFTEAINLKREWVWRPGESVKPYDCVGP